MSGHLSTKQITRYRQGSLAAAELITVGDHLALCTACRNQLGGADQVRNATVALSTELQAASDEGPVHLLPEQMAAYLDRQLDEVDLTIADSHLELCSECREELLELRELTTVLTNLTPEEQAVRPAPARWRTFAGSWRRPAYWVLLQAALIVLFVWMAIVPLRKQVAELKGQLSELQQINDSLQDELASLSEPRDRPPSSSHPSAESVNASLPKVALNDGDGRVTLDKDGNLIGLKSLAPAHEELVRTTLTTQRVKMPSVISELAGKREVLMGGASGRESFSLVGPVGTVLETDRPIFRWRSLQGARSYSVTIYNSASKKVIASPQLSGSEWTPSDPLERGVVYSWQVTALKDGKEITVPIPPAPQAKFKVLEQARLGELREARQLYSGSHLIIGLLFAQAGMLDEAEREFTALVAANPDSLTARRLLGSVKAPRKP